MSYPYWTVLAQVWNAEKEEYEYLHVGDFKKYKRAKAIFDETEQYLCADFNHVELFEEYEDETVRLAYKDDCGDEVITEWEHEPNVDTSETG